MRPERKTLSKKLDQLWGHVGKEKASCEVCATLPPAERINSTQLHPHHIIGRGNHIVRWDLKNRVWLCPYHHTLGKFSAHLNGLWFTDWLKKNKPKIFKYLEGKQYVTKQWTLEELEDILQILKKVS